MEPSPQLPPFHETFIPILKALADGSLKDRKAIQSAVREGHYADLPKELLQEKTMTGVATDYTEIMILKDTTRSWKIALFLPLLTTPQILVIAWLMNQVAGGI